MTYQPSDQPNWSHLVMAIGGAIAGSWLARRQVKEAKKSRAELDDPDGAREAYEEIGELLDRWEPASDCVTEADYTDDLAAYLNENTDWEIEICPATPEGKPDILIGDLIALELKIDPSKSERDRCVGQCAGYSRLWITWMVTIDASANKIGRIEDLLSDKGLEHIEVWNFS
jgi:hypothetical protein